MTSLEASRAAWLEGQLIATRERVRELESSLQAIVDAVDVPGIRPDVHRSAVRWLEDNWPTLTRSINIARRTLQR